MRNKYTIVGSRETPDDILHLMTKLVYKLAERGWCGRSGGADGVDTCLEDGVRSYISVTELPDNFIDTLQEVYLPWKDFNGRDSDSEGYYTSPYMDNKHEAEKLASELHPAWDKCSQGAKKLHTRNVYQVLGKDLKSPSKFLICYAKPVGKEGQVKGGTNTAVKLALDNNVEVFNMYLEEDRKRIETWLI